jgi:8-oxo-dGTP pyrophosphatase MutT (NUDIX family)
LNDAAARPSRLLDHIRRCNNRDLSRFRPFLAAAQQVGWVRIDFIERLREFGDLFEFAGDGVRLSYRFDTFEKRTAAMSEVVRSLVENRVFAKFRNENYAVVTEWGAAPLLLLDRSAVAPFGVRAFGVHINGYTRRGDKTLLWIGRRAMDKAVEPGKLDNMVAGGQPAGLSLIENLAKEAAEEAGIPRELALRAKPAGAISYCMEGDRGLKPDTMFVYDLEVPGDFVPRNVDGEFSDFRLMEFDEVVERVRTSYDFKFNVSLVLIDFLIRVGHITPENEPDYLALVSGLHAPP